MPRMGSASSLQQIVTSPLQLQQIQRLLVHGSGASLDVHAAQRFAWEINPRNYLLLACHAANETVQLNQLRRWYGYHYGDPTQSNPKVSVAQAALCKSHEAVRCNALASLSPAKGSCLYQVYSASCL